jgi:hypothetical protein
VRFAISAVAAASGVMLLGLSFYGQPAVYLRLASEQWDALMDRPVGDQSSGDQPAADQSAADQPATPDAGQSVASNAPLPVARNEDAANERAAQLQQEVARLQQQLAARQQAPAPAAPTPTGPAQPPAATAAPPSVVASASPTAADVAPPTMVVTAPPAPAAGPAPVPEMARTAPPPAAAPASNSATPPAAAPSTAQTATTTPAAMPTPPVQVPERREASLQAAPQRADRLPDQAKPEAAKPEPARTDAKPAQVRTESPKVEPPRPAAPRVVVQKAIPAPPPLPQSAPPRQGADDAQSVLARLRQVSPGAAPVQEAAVVPSPERPRPAPSPSLPRLSAARNAMASGQIDEARRLLQQAQLQLVFGPADSANDDSQVAGKGATDVAHALDALSANDVALSRRYVDAAMGDLSGAPVSAPIQESSRRASGYAPAYPPR